MRGFAQRKGIISMLVHSDRLSVFLGRRSPKENKLLLPWPEELTTKKNEMGKKSNSKELWKMKHEDAFQNHLATCFTFTSWFAKRNARNDFHLKESCLCVCACFFINLDGMITSTSSTPSKVPHRQVPRYAPWRIFDWLQSHRLEPFPKFQANRLEENWVSSWAAKKIAQKNGRHKTNIFSDSSRYNKKTTLSEI